MPGAFSHCGAAGLAPGELKALVRTVPDFPAKGIQFRDVTTLIDHPDGFRATVDWLASHAIESGATKIAGMEARGFIFGAAVAAVTKLGFVPVRKAGKLPVPVISADYDLEYGNDSLELDPSLIEAGSKVAIVDDLMATGGTACAAIELLRKAGAAVTCAAFVIELPDLGGRARVAGLDVPVHALMQFAGE